jgi:hypothetical protein
MTHEREPSLTLRALKIAAYSSATNNSIASPCSLTLPPLDPGNGIN